MEFAYFSRNGEIRPIDEAVVPLSSIEYQYGFGVYETLRVANGIVYFLQQHIDRLLESARAIGLVHAFTSEILQRSVEKLVEKTGKGTYNLKILLVGGSEPALYIVPLNPLFPDKKLYRDGVACTTYRFERPFPHAKTLNMLESYLAFRQAKEAGAYEALFLDGAGNIVEGTRSNFFCIKDKTLISPPSEKILLGVTRAVLLKVASAQGFEVLEQDIPVPSLGEFDGAFLTSTSSNIMPIKSIDGVAFGEQSAALKELIAAFDTFLAECGGALK